MRYSFFIILLISLNFVSAQSNVDNSLQTLIEQIQRIEIQQLRNADFAAVVNRADKTGKFPIHYATEKENIEIIKLLLDQGAAINCADKYGYTPLHYAASSPKTSIANYLINKGGNRFALNHQNEFPVDIAYQVGNKNVVTLLLNEDTIASQIERYRLWRNHYFIQSTLWEAESTDFKMAWINGSLLMGKLFRLLKPLLSPDEIAQFKLLEEDQKHFEYKSEFQMDMNFKISLCDQLLAIIAKKSSNKNILMALSMFTVPSNQSRIQLETLKKNLVSNNNLPKNIITINNNNHGKN